MPKTCAAIVIAAKHGELIKVKDYSGITNTVGALRCKFEFRTNDWDNATMTAVFCKGNMATHPEIVDNAIGVLLDSVDECAVPAEVLTKDAKYFSVGIWGVTATGLRIVSEWLVYRIKDGCYVDATEPIEPTPTVYEQIMLSLQSKASVDHKHSDIYYTKEEIDNMETDIDEDILKQITSNTEARHTHSNKNTIDKFSEDNNGNPLYNGQKIVVDETDPTVPTWAKQPNKPSYTASEVGALPNTTKIPETTSDLTNDSGYITSDVASLTNYYKKSEVYAKTDIDNKGFITNTELEASVESALITAKASGEFDGQDGLSAYQIWLNEGNTGTEEDFLTSLKGEDGINGEKGEPGIDGKDGNDGYTPIKGIDYYTEEDKSEIINSVLNSLPTWSGGAY